MNRYEEYRTLPTFWGWVVLFGLSAALLAFGMLSHHLIPDVERHWDYGTLPDTPSESIYSTVRPDLDLAPRRQILPLPGATLDIAPEARAWKPMAPAGKQAPP